MEIDRESCLAAFLGRDRRFAGRFYAGVKTTGVYCRPGCPAPLPKPRNVLFFPCAAAAEEAGFRACRRCRPETAPGTPAWAGTSATVARALRQIEAGLADDVPVADLAARLGVGERHLRRLFAEHLGASPLAVARTRRLHFARRLLDDTALRMSDVALAAGYSSVRRFNEAMRDAFGGDRPAALCRELTKTYEQVIRGTLADLVTAADGGLRGEITLVVGGAPVIAQAPPDEAELAGLVQELVTAGRTRRDAVDEIAARLGLPRRAVYAAAVATR